MAPTTPTTRAELEEGPEPCYGCPCCALWAEALQLLRDHAATHVAGELRLAPCDPECLICGEVEWQATVATPDEVAAARRQLLDGKEPPR